MDEQTVIFDLTKENCDYRGIIFADVDFAAMPDGCGPPLPASFQAGVMAIIFIDENGDWQLVSRIKFPSGNKQVIKKNFGKDSSETVILQTLYNTPMKNKIWARNHGGKPDGIVKILEDLDMIESI